jgi:hypothetical protein
MSSRESSFKNIACRPVLLGVGRAAIAQRRTGHNL